MVELERRIFVDRYIMLNEYDYTFGEKKTTLFITLSTMSKKTKRKGCMQTPITRC